METAVGGRGTGRYPFSKNIISLKILALLFPPPRLRTPMGMRKVSLLISSLSYILCHLPLVMLISTAVKFIL